MPNRAELVAAGIDPEAYVGQIVDWYDGSIRGMDAELGRLFEALRAQGLDRDTLVVFIADHGEEFLEHGELFHGQSVYAELARTPLILRWPGRLPAARVVAETVEAVDLMPTLLELSGLDVPEGLQGESLVALLDERDGAKGRWRPRPAVTEKNLTRDEGSPARRGLDARAFVAGGWKLIHNREGRGDRPEFELYQVAADALDRADRAAEHPEVVARLARELAAWQARAQAARLASDGAAAAELAPEELERLRSLGYIQ
jgi:arylsulfatase A-like enzyme